MAAPKHRKQGDLLFIIKLHTRNAVRFQQIVPEAAYCVSRRRRRRYIFHSPRAVHYKSF